MVHVASSDLQTMCRGLMEFLTKSSATHVLDEQVHTRDEPVDVVSYAFLEHQSLAAAVAADVVDERVAGTVMSALRNISKNVRVDVPTDLVLVQVMTKTASRDADASRQVSDPVTGSSRSHRVPANERFYDAPDGTSTVQGTADSIDEATLKYMATVYAVRMKEGQHIDLLVRWISKWADVIRRNWHIHMTVKKTSTVMDEVSASWLYFTLHLFLTVVDFGNLLANFGVPTSAAVDKIRKALQPVLRLVRKFIDDTWAKLPSFWSKYPDHTWELLAHDVLYNVMCMKESGDPTPAPLSTASRAMALHLVRSSFARLRGETEQFQAADPVFLGHANNDFTEYYHPRVLARVCLTWMVKHPCMSCIEFDRQPAVPPPIAQPGKDISPAGAQARREEQCVSSSSSAQPRQGTAGPIAPRELVDIHQPGAWAIDIDGDGCARIVQPGGSERKLCTRFTVRGVGSFATADGGASPWCAQKVDKATLQQILTTVAVYAVDHQAGAGTDVVLHLPWSKLKASQVARGRTRKQIQLVLSQALRGAFSKRDGILKCWNQQVASKWMTLLRDAKCTTLLSGTELARLHGAHYDRVEHNFGLINHLAVAKEEPVIDVDPRLPWCLDAVGGAGTHVCIVQQSRLTKDRLICDRYRVNGMGSFQHRLEAPTIGNPWHEKGVDDAMQQKILNTIPVYAMDISVQPPVQVVLHLQWAKFIANPPVNGRRRTIVNTKTVAQAFNVNTRKGFLDRWDDVIAGRFIGLFRDLECCGLHDRGSMLKIHESHRNRVIEDHELVDKVVYIPPTTSNTAHTTASAASTTATLTSSKTTTPTTTTTTSGSD